MQSLLDELKQTLLSEDVAIPLGTIVSYVVRGEEEVGVVIGVDGRDVYVVDASTPPLFNTSSRKALRDVDITTRMGKELMFKGVRMDVQKVPYQKINRLGRIVGRNLRMYAALASNLQQMRGTT